MLQTDVSRITKRSEWNSNRFVNCGGCQEFRTCGYDKILSSLKIWQGGSKNFLKELLQRSNFRWGYRLYHRHGQRGNSKLRQQTSIHSRNEQSVCVLVFMKYPRTFLTLVASGSRFVYFEIRTASFLISCVEKLWFFHESILKSSKRSIHYQVGFPEISNTKQCHGCFFVHQPENSILFKTKI